ncbi:MAG: histidine phosphatase family protein [bacterium]|nr:histidine phosphatase family protein [bacterium]
MIELVFVRHGQPAWVDENNCAVDEPGLSELGHQQAQRVAQALADEKFDAFYVSDLLRARQTAEPIAKALGMEPVVIPWFKEYQAKKMNGTPGNAVQEYFMKWRTCSLAEKKFGPPGGETWEHILERVTSGIEALMASNGINYVIDGSARLWKFPETPKRILFVGHTFASGVAIHHLLGIEHTPWEGERFRQGWCAISRLIPFSMASGFIWRLKVVDDRRHLSDLACDDE